MSGNQKQDVKSRFTEELRYSIIQSAIELGRFLSENYKNYPNDLVEYNLSETQSIRESSREKKENIKKYQLVRGVYHLSAMLGWLELCRQNYVFLESRTNPVIAQFESKAREFQNALFSDPLPKDVKDDEIDAYILPEEQRAIGDRMIAKDGDAKVIIGYAGFCADLFRFPYAEPDYWINHVILFYFLYEFESEDSVKYKKLSEETDKDHRPKRIERILKSLYEIIETLDPASINNEVENWKNFKINFDLDRIREINKEILDKTAEN